MARNFAAELAAAREAGDWDAHARIWEERRVGSVEADEAALEDEYAPGDKVIYRGDTVEIDHHYESSGDYLILCHDGYRQANPLELSRPAGSPDQTVERSALVGGVQLPGTAPATLKRQATVQRACSEMIGRCEALEAEASDQLACDQAEPVASFWRGQKSTAKSLRRHFADLMVSA